MKVLPWRLVLRSKRVVWLPFSELNRLPVTVLVVVWMQVAISRSTVAGFMSSADKVQKNASILVC
jgi:predicted ABC-type exoprotein transport system permease subunit